MRLAARRKRFFLLPAALRIFSGIALLVAANALALERPRPSEFDQLRQDPDEMFLRQQRASAYGNNKIRPELLKYAEAKLGALAKGEDPAKVPPPAWQGMPTKGTNNVLVFLIDFPDQPHVNSYETITNKLFGAGLPSEFPLESLTKFYQRSSYGQLTIQGSALGWYRMAHPRDWYTDTYGDGNDANYQIIKEVAEHFNASINYSQFDNNGDGKVDYFAVLWAGPDNGWANFWWGYQWELASNLTLDGVRFQSFSWQWESRPVGSSYHADVIIHETGHALGLPDYYDYDGSVGPDGGVGGMDMMDANYCDHNCFSKFILDWITPTVVTTALSRFPQRNGADYPEAIALAKGYPGTTAFSEYFMVQNRQKVNNDVDLPGSGLVVWHVDARLDGGDYQYNNSYTGHKLLRLMEADGLEEIEAGGGGDADAGDFYVAGKEFTPNSSPNSFFYNGSNSDVRVSAIAVSNQVMIADYSVVDNQPVIDRPRVYVRENDVTNVSVSILRPLVADTVITISRLSGSSNLYVVGSPSFTFTPDNWSNAQTFAVGSLNDADMDPDTAVFRMTASGGGVQSADFVVEQMDTGDNVPPQCSFSGALSGGGAQVLVHLVFDESVMGFDGTDILLSSIGCGASLVSLTDVSGLGREYQAVFSVSNRFGSLSLTIPAGSLTDMSGNMNPNPEYRFTYTIPFLRTDYFDDFEGVATSWTPTTAEYEDYTTVGWRWGVPEFGTAWTGPVAAVSGSKCLGTMDGPYAKRLDAWIESPAIRVGTSPMLSFQLWMAAQGYAFGAVEVNNGYGWYDMTPDGAYTDTAGGWMPQDIELDDALFGNRVLRVRFRAVAYLPGGVVPMYVDDVRLQSQQPPGIYVTAISPDSGYAGTTVPVSVSIYNSTASEQSNLMGFVTCADAGVTITNGVPVFYGNVGPGALVTGAAPVQLELAASGGFDAAKITLQHQAKAGWTPVASDAVVFTVLDAGVTAATNLLTIRAGSGVANWVGEFLTGDGSSGSCLFQAIDAGANGVADPPRADGGVTGDDRLLVGAVDGVTVGRFGEGGVVPNAGLFSRIVAHSLASNALVYVRAWDASSFAGSAVYGDSALKAVSGASSQTITFPGWSVAHVLRFPGPSLKDMADRDGDSIPDAWCALFGVNPNRPIQPLPASVMMEASVTGLNRPGRVAVSSNLVFIADSDNNRIEVWNRALTTRLTRLGSLGTGTNNFNRPQGLSVSPDGTRLLVGDTLNYRVMMFAVDPVSGALTHLWSAGAIGVATDGPLFFRAPYGISLQDGGAFLVADSHSTDFYANHSVQVYSDASNRVTLIGTDAGSGDGSFMRPLGVDAGLSGEIFVADSGNHRIQGFLSDGTFSWVFGAYGTGLAQFKEPRDVSLGLGGRLYVAETGGNRIQVLDVDAAPDVTSLVVLGSNGSGPGQFRAPQGVAPALDDGIIYVADTFNNRVQKLRVVLDGDGDGMEDVWEELHGLDCHDPSDAGEDPDGDGLSNIGEYRLGTDPSRRDTNGNGASDGWDVAHGLNPAATGGYAVVPPTVAIASDPSGTVYAGTVVRVTATFSEAVSNAPAPKLSLDGGAFLWQAAMTMGSPSSWYYDYTVQSGDAGPVNAAVSGAVDLDGLSLDTDPTIVEAVFTVGTAATLAITGFGVTPQVLAWPAILDEIYQIQSSTNLMTNLWTEVGAVTSPASGTITWTNTAPITNAVEFFRIRWMNAP